MANIKSCKPCIRGKNEYEQEIASGILNTLNDISCIKWYYNENSEEIKNQYGIIQIVEIKELNAGKKEIKEAFGKEGCIGITTVIDVQVILFVVGVHKYDAIERRPSDVLLRIKDVFKVIESKKDLMNNMCGKITIDSSVRIHERHEASMDITFQLQRTTSIAIDII